MLASHGTDPTRARYRCRMTEEHRAFMEAAKAQAGECMDEGEDAAAR